MMRGVSLTDGMRRFAARRRTVDSLTCKNAASCRAVRNSSRSSVFDISLSGLCGQIQRNTINSGAIDLHVLRHWLCTLSLNTHTILPRLGREPELERTSLRRDASIDLLRCSVCKYSRQLHFRIRYASTVSIKDAATEKRDRPLVDRQDQAVTEGPSLSGFDLDILDRADAQARLSERQPVKPGRQFRDNKISVFTSGRARDFSFSAPHDDNDACRRPGFHTNFALDGAQRLILSHCSDRAGQHERDHKQTFLESHRQSFT